MLKCDGLKNLMFSLSMGSIICTAEFYHNPGVELMYNLNVVGVDSISFGLRRRALPEESIRVFEPVFIRQSPGNEATLIDTGNGIIKIFYINRPRTADKMMSIASHDNGITWNYPEMEFSLPGEAYYANNLVKGINGELHCVFHIWGKGDNGYNGRHLDLYYCRNESNGDGWTKPKKIYDGYVGSIRGFIHLINNRLLLAFARAVPSRNQKPAGNVQDFGWNEIISMYSDDLGETWFSSENGINIPVESTQVTRYGGVEPEIIELNDKRVWMLIRTNKGSLYESFSENYGITWLPPRPTHFFSSDSPADLLRLSDGRIVILWSGNQRWDDDRSYANGGREVLHAAISSDDGVSWKGYREVLISPSGHFVIKRDIGTAYPSAIETNEGKVLFVSGQAEERAVVMFDPDWLQKTSARDNFKEGLVQWTLFGADTATGISPLPSGEKGSALLITKSVSNRNHDTEVIWNFPMSQKGILVINVLRNRGSKGINIALTDHFSVSYDTLASEKGVFSFSAGSEKDAEKTKNLRIRIKWDCLTGKALAYIDNKLLCGLDFRRISVEGLNYLRMGIPGSEPDPMGYFIKSVKLIPLK
ncbi:MAG TPA: hypothetical protein DDW27_08805 [Bacteroidales bacterium]|nr:hypothetical protein [Bacteroidales bacterium]